MLTNDEIRAALAHAIGSHVFDTEITISDSNGGVHHPDGNAYVLIRCQRLPTKVTGGWWSRDPANIARESKVWRDHMDLHATS